MEFQDEAINEIGRQVSTWLRRLHTEGSSALKDLQKWDKTKLRETLDWIQANVPVKERRANLLAIETALIEELKEKRAAPPKRQFLKFHFGNKEASLLLLRNTLRERSILSQKSPPRLWLRIALAQKFRHFCVTMP